MALKNKSSKFLGLQTKFESQDTTTAVAIAAVEASYRTKAKAIVVLTSSGVTARLVSKFRPTCPIIAVSRLMNGILFKEPALSTSS
jgi:pyruvate kinase